MRGSRGSKIGEATAGSRRRAETVRDRREPVHPSFDFASISAARISPGSRPSPEPFEAEKARRSMASPIKAEKLPQQSDSVIDIESRLKAAEERLKRAADVAPH